MNELIIQTKLPHFQKTTATISSLLLIVGSFIVLITKLVDSLYDIPFYTGLVCLIVGIISLLAFTVWLPKPAITINLEGLYPNLSDQSSLKPIIWDEVENVNIGLNFLQIILKVNKTVNIDLSNLRYNDLKNIKTKVIEICENKNISYRNA